MNFIDFFSGAGMFRMGMELAGFKPNGYVEINKQARDTYETNFNTNGEWTAHDINEVNAKEIPVSDIWCGGFPCFSKDVLIMTNEGYKKIQDIKIGDYVLTHKNTFEKVLFPMINKAEYIYEVSIFGSERFKVTENHPFYVRTMSREWDKKDKKEKRIFSEPNWTEVKDLNKNHYIGVAINQESKLPNWNGITYENKGREYKLHNLDFMNKNLWWLIGRYIGDGWYRITNRKDCPKSPNYRTIICCNKKEKNEIIEKIEGLFTYSISKEKTTYKFHIVNKELTVYLMQFGKYAYGKHLTSDIFNLPIEYLQSFIEGYFSADGCLLSDSKTYHSNTVSRELAYGIQACIHKAYKIPVRLYYVPLKDKHIIEDRVVNQRNQYYVRYKTYKCNQDKAFYENGYIWVPFKEKKLLEYHDYVYNLEVENNHSYTVQNLIVHNCKNLSTANVTTRLGLDGEQSGLFWTFCNLIEQSKIKPKYLFLENVQGFTTIKGGLDFLKALCRIDSLGYNIKYEVSSALLYNVPQNRIRTYLICTKKEDTLLTDYEHKEIEIKSKTININGLNIHNLYDTILNSNYKIKINWNKRGIVENGICHSIELENNNITNLTLSTILETEVDDKYYLNEEQLIKIRKMKGSKERILEDGRIWKEGAVPFPDRIDKNARCVTPSDGSLNRSTHVILDNKGYRKLTIRERARLQCLPDNFVFPVSDSQASLQLGNGVVVEVIKQIAEREITNIKQKK